MPPIQEHGYEGDYGYDDADWDGGRQWGRQQEGWDVQQQQRQRQELMYDRRQQPQEIAPHQRNHVGYVSAATAPHNHNGVYDRYDNTAAAAQPRISYAGRTVGPAAVPPAPDWPPYANRTVAAAGVAGMTTPPRHLRKLPQIPKPAEITQKLQQQKQFMANNIR